VCNAESDCTVAGEHCGLAQNDAAELVTVCRAADPGDVEVGQRCGDDGFTLGTIEPSSGCVTNLCSNNNTCSTICDQDGDCGAGFSCIKFEVNDEDQVGLCLEGDRCSTNTDCAVGEACVQVAGATGIEFICTNQFPGTLDGGAACDIDVNFGTPFVDANGPIDCFNDADCTALLAGSTCDIAQRRCVGPIAELCELGCNLVDNECSEICQTDGDCGAANRRCEGNNVVFDANDPATTDDDEIDTFGVCTTRDGAFTDCTRTADCTAPDVCQPVVSLAGTVSGKCAAALTGGVAAGAACGIIGGAGVLCAEGFCEDEDLTDEIIVGSCRSLCATNDDCTAPATCQLVADAIGPNLDLNVCK
jgi:hypothetical protein